METEEMAPPAAVAAQLSDASTRDTALSQLEGCSGPHAGELALAVAPALGKLLVADAAEVDAPMARRVGLLLARIIGEADSDEAMLAVHGAAFADGRYREVHTGTRSAGVRPLLEKPAEALDREDALTYACVHGTLSSAVGGSGGVTAANRAVGLTDLEWYTLYVRRGILGKEHLPTDEVPLKLSSLLVELLRAPEQLPPWALGGVWELLDNLILHRTVAGKRAFELGILELAVAQLRAIGSPAERLTKRPADVVTWLTNCMRELARGQPAETAQAITLARASSGYFDECVAMLTAFEQHGVEHVQDTNASGLYNAISVIGKCTKVPGCEVKLRGVASALGFAQGHSLAFASETGTTSGGAATQIICTLWGREEEGSAFTFTQAHVDSL
jgi:hypothetical protein